MKYGALSVLIGVYRWSDKRGFTRPPGRLPVPCPPEIPELSGPRFADGGLAQSPTPWRGTIPLKWGGSALKSSTLEQPRLKQWWGRRGRRTAREEKKGKRETENGFRGAAEVVGLFIGHE